MYQKKNASAQVCKHKAVHDVKKNDIAHTTFQYKYTNKESWGVLHYARGVRPLTKNTSNIMKNALSKPLWIVQYHEHHVHSDVMFLKWT